MENKNLIYSLIAIGAFILMLSPSGSMAATYDGAWEPSDSIIYFIDLTFPSGSGSLYMYDYDEGTDDDLWVMNDGGISQAIIYVHQGSGGDWYAGYTANGEQLNLGRSRFSISPRENEVGEEPHSPGEHPHAPEYHDHGQDHAQLSLRVNIAVAYGSHGHDRKVKGVRERHSLDQHEAEGAYDHHGQQHGPEYSQT